MTVDTISRRGFVKTGACALVGASSFLPAANALASHLNTNPDTAIAAQKGLNMTKEQLIRTYYSGWEKKDWSLIDGVLGDRFTFTSPNDDDHLPKPAFKARCWPQADFIERFELESVLAGGNEAFVKYLCRTTKNTSFRNTEYFRFAAGRITAIECYFGGHLGYPTASITGKP